MLIAIHNHFRLTRRLFVDQRINRGLKIFLVGIPIVYALFPMPHDMLPVIGLLDDLFFVGISTLIFTSLCPPSLVAEHRRELTGETTSSGFNLDPYRYPNETRDLALGFGLMIGLLAAFGYLAGVLALLIFALGYFATGLMRGQLLGNAVQVTERQLPALHRTSQAAQANLPPVQINLFVVQDPRMNAFTFGYKEPYAIVLTSALVEKMEPEEIQAVIGHELGHILFEHVRLINIMAGLGGLFRILFFQWSRSCEYSADAIALLSTGWKPEPMVSAMLKLASGLSEIEIDLDEFLAQVDQNSRTAANSAEIFSTHPLIYKRIQRLVQLAKDPGTDQVQFVPAVQGS
jgi:Zn-dependent protease with chaperone function